MSYRGKIKCDIQSFSRAVDNNYAVSLVWVKRNSVKEDSKTQSETQPEDKIAENSDIARARIYKKYPAAMEIKLKLKLQIKKSRQIDQGENSDV